MGGGGGRTREIDFAAVLARESWRYEYRLCAAGTKASSTRLGVGERLLLPGARPEGSPC